MGYHPNSQNPRPSTTVSRVEPLSPLTDRLDVLRSETSEQRLHAANAIDVMTKLPDMLGAHGEVCIS